MLTRSASRILIVGAGAVGQVYGYHLTQAGCDVSFLVKPKYAAEAREGFHLHHHKLSGTEHVKFKPAHVYTSVLDARGIWHQVWLCVPSPALREPWLDELAGWIGGDATLITLQPGLDELEHVWARFPKERVVEGLIGMISYQAPLPGQHLAPGVAFFYPPLAPSQFGGPRERAIGVVELLQKGGCPAAHAEDAHDQALVGTSLLTPMVAALEVADWSFDKLIGSQMLDIALEAATEAADIVQAKSGAQSWPLAKLRNRHAFKFGLPIARKILPFPIETYLRYHFTKVRSQTQGNMAQFVSYGQRLGKPTTAIQRLIGLWNQSLNVQPETQMASLAQIQPAPASLPSGSVSASFAAVNVPILAAPVVDDDEEPRSPLLPADGTTTPRLEIAPKRPIAPAETVPAVLVTNPPRIVAMPPNASDDDLTENTPLPVKPT